MKLHTSPWLLKSPALHWSLMRPACRSREWGKVSVFEQFVALNVRKKNTESDHNSVFNRLTEIQYIKDIYSLIYWMFQKQGSLGHTDFSNCWCFVFQPVLQKNLLNYKNPPVTATKVQKSHEKCSWRRSWGWCQGRGILDSQLQVKLQTCSAPLCSVCEPPESRHGRGYWVHNGPGHVQFTFFITQRRRIQHVQLRKHFCPDKQVTSRFDFFLSRFVLAPNNPVPTVGRAIEGEDNSLDRRKLPEWAV